MSPNSFMPFEQMNTVHFVRWMIAPPTEKYGGTLIYSANIDGTVDQHFQDLVNQFSDQLDEILVNCKDYPSGENRTYQSRLSYLRSHSRKTPAFYVGAPNRSVDQIHKEAELHSEVRNYVKENSASWKSEKEAYKAIKEFLKDPRWDWARDGYTLPKSHGFKMILILLLVLLLLPILIIVILCIHFFYELSSKPFGKSINQVPEEHLRKMKSQEDIIYQNQLSQAFETKGGLRKLLLKFLLWATNFAAKNWFVKGRLFGTPTIHFARWVFIDGGKRFVFFSNFDGSYDGYLGDFVDNNGWGLNAIYGAAKGYPRTFFVFGRGSYRLLEFMGWGRITQVETQLWYSAYPWYGLQQINSRSALREELFTQKNPTEAQIKQTLQRI